MEIIMKSHMEVHFHIGDVKDLDCVADLNTG